MVIPHITGTGSSASRFLCVGPKRAIIDVICESPVDRRWLWFQGETSSSRFNYANYIATVRTMSSIESSAHAVHLPNHHVSTCTASGSAHPDTHLGQDIAPISHRSTFKVFPAAPQFLVRTCHFVPCDIAATYTRAGRIPQRHL